MNQTALDGTIGIAIDAAEPSAAALQSLPGLVAELIARLAPAAAESATAPDPLRPCDRNPERLVAARRLDDGGTLRIVPDLPAVLRDLHNVWWAALSGPDRIAVRIHSATAPRVGPATVSDVLIACETADQPTPMHSTLSTGRVRPDPQKQGSWLAEVGTGSTLRTLGSHHSVAAAEAAVRNAVKAARDAFRDTLRTYPQPLPRLADVPWQEPTIQVWATEEQRWRSQ